MVHSPTVTLPHHLDADQIFDEIKRQFRPLAERGRKPEVIEISEQYASQLDSKFLARAHCDDRHRRVRRASFRRRTHQARSNARHPARHHGLRYEPLAPSNNQLGPSAAPK